MISKSCDCRIVFRILQAAFLPTHRGIHVCCLICNLTLHIISPCGAPPPPGQKGGIPSGKLRSAGTTGLMPCFFDWYGGRKAIHV